MAEEARQPRLRRLALVADALVNDPVLRRPQLLTRLMALGVGVIVSPPVAGTAALAVLCECIVGDLAQHRASGGRVWLIGPAQMRSLGLPRAALDAAAAALRVPALGDPPWPAPELALPPGAGDDELTAVLASIEAG